MRIRHHVNPLADLTEHRFAGFDNDKPIVLDIGADRGEFTEQLLKKFGKEKNFIVSEIRKPLAKKLQEKFKDYPNVKVFDGDIGRNFKKIICPSVKKGVLLERVYINFPDPWFKERHKKRRVLNEKFLQSIFDWVQPETEWIFQTDQEKLFQETLEMLRSFSNIKITLFHQPPYGFKTKWEEAQTEKGAKVYRAKFQFTAH